MSEKKEQDLIEFHKNMDYTLEELLEKSMQENWSSKKTELWLKVKNTQNLELLRIYISDIRDSLRTLDKAVRT